MDDVRFLPTSVDPLARRRITGEVVDATPSRQNIRPMAKSTSGNYGELLRAWRRRDNLTQHELASGSAIWAGISA